LLYQSTSVAPLVVIPGHDLGQVFPEDHGKLQIDYGGMFIAPEVRGNEPFLLAGHDPLQGLPRRHDEDLAEVIRCGLSLQLRREVHD